jgi:hypothetical protein
MDMRLEFASTKEDITTELAVKTATIAAMVHHFKENGFTTHLHQIRDKYWWTEEYRQEVFKVVTDAMDHVDPGWSAWSGDGTFVSRHGQRIRCRRTRRFLLLQKRRR